MACSRRRYLAIRPSALRPENQTVRNAFVIGPDKKIKLILVYPMTRGRNFDEVLRVIDSLQLTAKHKVATLVNWKNGEDVIGGGRRAHTFGSCRSRAPRRCATAFILSRSKCTCAPIKPHSESVVKVSKASVASHYPPRR